MTRRPALDPSRRKAERVLKAVVRSRSAKRKTALAHQALALYPDCVGAYDILLEHDSPTDFDILANLLKAVDAGERALGRRRLKKLASGFDTDPEAFDLLSHYDTLARAALEAGHVDLALVTAWRAAEADLLDLVDQRLLFASCLLEKQERPAQMEAHRLIKGLLQLPGYQAQACWQAAYALVLFQFNGDCRKSRAALNTAFFTDPDFAQVLLDPPAPEMIPFLEVESEERFENTLRQADTVRRSWAHTPGALEWLAAQSTAFRETNGLEQSPFTTSERRALERRFPREVADALVAEAYLTDSESQQRQLVDRALALSDDSTRAFCLAARLESEPTRKLELYTLGMEAAQRVLGSKFKKLKRKLWSDPVGRDYLVARCGVAYHVWVLGDRQRAIEHYAEILALDPEEHVPVRQVLVACLLEEQSPEACARALQVLEPSLEDDRDGEQTGGAYGSPLYNQALALIQAAQREPEALALAKQVLISARLVNPHTLWLLLDVWEVPRRLPQAWTFGDYTEAIDYVSYARQAWAMTPGALALLEEFTVGAPAVEEPDFVPEVIQGDRPTSIGEYLNFPRERLTHVNA